MDRYFTTFEAAKICHASPGSLIRWIHQGRIPTSLTAGGHHRIHSKDLVTFLKKLRLPIPEELMEVELKILIITEKQSFLRGIQKPLRKRFPDACVDEAADYFAAGWKASRLQPDLVILDLQLPETEAVKIGEMMRGFFEYTDTAILSLLPVESLRLQKKMQSLGIGEWLVKPFSKDELVKKVETMLLSKPQNQMTGS